MFLVNSTFILKIYENNLDLEYTVLDAIYWVYYIGAKIVSRKGHSIKGKTGRFCMHVITNNGRLMKWGRVMSYKTTFQLTY